MMSKEPKTMSKTLPPPEQWVLVKMNEMEVAELIEKHIDYVVRNDNGVVRSVHLPMPFVRHFINRDDNVLPTVATIATSPIVLPNGKLLAPEGLDRDRGILFKIQKEMLAIMPRSTDCTRKAVRAAMRYLCDLWLADVATDYAGKCVIIATALTIIERSLLPERPVFFITAGRSKAGKTTTLTMLLMAVTGLRPAASAWSSNEEERRKALLSYFLYGVPYILWDNIAKGSQLSCPHIEKSCTSGYYADRKLGVSEMVLTAAASIHLFTGNNIGPKGDLATRALHAHLEVTRHDPENRDFKHPDPVGWTEEHRGEIIQAFYTILLGNPQLSEPLDAPAKTRFKTWWRLVGSAIEYAADDPVDFRELFAGQEADDEEMTSLADALDILATRYPDEEEFKAVDISTIINDGLPYDVAPTLREVFAPELPSHATLSPKVMGRRLKKNKDAPVRFGERTLTLLSRVDPNSNDLHWRIRMK